MHPMSLELWEIFWIDSESMINDIRGREMVKQMTRSVYSISANIEEGYGRGFGKEYPQFLNLNIQLDQQYRCTNLFLPQEVDLIMNQLNLKIA